jgi:hypothetical protein
MVVPPVYSTILTGINYSARAIVGAASNEANPIKNPRLLSVCPALTVNSLTMAG